MCILDFFNSQFVSAAAGGLIGGGLTFLGVRITLKNDVDKEARAVKAELASFCNSIRTELSCLLRIYLVSCGEELAKLTSDQPFLFYYPVYEKYTTIFDSNSQLLGKISDEGTRTEIVQVYLSVKGHLDSLRYNNYLFQQYQDFFNRAIQTKNPYDIQQRDLFLFQMKMYSKSLLAGHSVFLSGAEDIIEKLRNFGV
jgi:hypothetical protein